ncbi:unnamed protein product, partial [Staurois parvus]
MRFIWADKHSRVSKSTLFAHRLQGGLGVPNIAPLSMLHASSDVPLWVLLETCAPNCASPCPIALSPIDDSSTLVASPPLLPIINNPLFPPGLDHPGAFSWWVTNGFSQVRHFLIFRSFPTWDSLRESRNIPPAEFFRYLQLRHWLLSLRGTSAFPYQKSAFEQLCQLRPGAPGLISLLYAALNRRSSHTSLSYVVQWERDLGVAVDPEDWNKAWSLIAKCSFNTTTLEAAYKVLFRWYWVPARLARANPACSDQCFRGCSHRGDVLHIWWSCPRLFRFWSRVFGLLFTLF